MQRNPLTVVMNIGESHLTACKGGDMLSCPLAVVLRKPHIGLITNMSTVL